MIDERFDFKRLRDRHAVNVPKYLLTPPPNVTGSFHLGHLLNLTIISVIKHYLEAGNVEVDLTTGFDHAGSSAEVQVDSKRGLSKLEKVEALIRKSELSIDTFKEQVQRWKLPVNFSRSRFTLTDDFRTITKLAITVLDDKGYLAYRNIFLNFEPIENQVYADAEVRTVKVSKTAYFYDYRLRNDPHRTLRVMTTLPFSVLGDVALCFNPVDERYSKFLNLEVQVPGTERFIPVLAHDSIDMNFGTGVVKVTPCYDKRDHKIADILELTSIDVFDQNCRCVVDGFIGMSFSEVNEKLIELAVDTEVISGTVKETRNGGARVYDFLSREWGIDLKLLALRYGEKILKETSVNPSWARNEARAWLDKMDFWPVSRKATWGVRINSKWILDTWFNASLWPLFRFDLDGSYCYDYLVSGWDLIFFWFWKMSLVTMAISGKIAFRKVIFHGLVTDDKGRKMSKSLGNVNDPQDLIDSYGNDRIRLSAVLINPDNKYVQLDPSNFRIVKLLNKLRSVYRFLWESEHPTGTVNTGLRIDLYMNWIDILRRIRGPIFEGKVNHVFDTLNDWVFSFSYVFIESFKRFPSQVYLRDLRFVFGSFMRLNSFFFMGETINMPLLREKIRVLLPLSESEKDFPAWISQTLLYRLRNLIIALKIENITLKSNLKLVESFNSVRIITGYGTCLYLVFDNQSYEP